MLSDKQRVPPPPKGPDSDSLQPVNDSESYISGPNVVRLHSHLSIFENAGRNARFWVKCANKAAKCMLHLWCYFLMGLQKWVAVPRFSASQNTFATELLRHVCRA